MNTIELVKRIIYFIFLIQKLIKMAKSISLSFSMDDLYLIDNSHKAKKHSLSGNGVDISLDANGNIQVQASPNQNPGNDGVMRSKANNQWSFNYNESLNQLFFIGITDLVGNKNPESHAFDLRGGAVNVRVLSNSLLVTT